MSLLHRVGLLPKTGSGPRRTGLRLEGRHTDEPVRRLSRRHVLERLGLLAALTVLAMLAFPNVSVYDGSAEVGDVWKGEEVVAPFDFAIRLSDDELEARRDSARRQVPPVFAENNGALAQTLARLDSVDARLDSAFAAFGDWQRGRSSLRSADAPASAAAQQSVAADSARYASAAAALRITLTPRHWEHLVRSAWERDAGTATGLSLGDQLLGVAGRIARDELSRGVLNVSRDSIYAETFLVRNLDPTIRTELEVQRDEVMGIDEAHGYAAQLFGEAFPNRPDTVAIGVAFLRAALVPSLVYQEDATQRSLEETVEAVLPSKGVVRQQYTIIRRGDVVTPERGEQLRSLRMEQRERSGVSWARTLLGRLVLVLAALTPFFLYLFVLRPSVFDDTRRLLLIVLLFGAVLGGFLVAGALGGVSHLVVPVSLALVLLTIVFDSRVGSFATITLAALGGLLFGFDFEFAFATLFVGVLAVLSVRDVKNRSQLLASAGLVLVAYALVLLGYTLLRADPFSMRFVSELTAASVNAVLLLLAAPLLWGIERLFGVTTDMTLLELSDTNRPLLKELSLRAPGTFNHSLQVANLAEAASDAIGANALRARVGALYHDIGKMLKPEYYIENQQPGENPHEKLKPSMSALVIAAHVKDGVELGREHRLPDVVLDFIRSHHGTSTMDFFFRKAQELRGPEDPEPVEAEFRYPGPRPRTTEQAIVMLADSVEAASRSVDKPTPKRLESLVDAILSARIADGQLDKTALTFADLARIRESFHSLLCGIYHFRVKYPDQPDDAEPGEALPPAPSNRPAPENTGFVAPSAADALVEDDKEGSGLKRGFRERSSLG